MSDNTTMHVPSHVKEIAEKSVEQAEKAITAFLDAAGKSVEKMVPTPAKYISKTTLTMTEKNIKAAFEHTKKLLQACDVHEFMRLQSEYLTNQFSRAQDQMKQLGSEMMSAGKSATSTEPKNK